MTEPTTTTQFWMDRIIAEAIAAERARLAEAVRGLGIAIYRSMQ